MKTRHFLISLPFLFLFSYNSARSVDLAEIEQKLHKTGVEGWVHGSVPDNKLYVFTYRNPNNFFDSIDMSLIPTDKTVAGVLETLKRHDKIRVKGSFLENPSPQKHIEVTSIEVIQKFNNPYNPDPYSYDTRIPDDLLNHNEARVLVHAVGGNGNILVVEYGDAVLPIFVKNSQLVKNLYRNDIINIKYSVLSEPQKPIHLRLNERAPQPVTIIESVIEKHGKPALVEGPLVLFPKSPGIMFNVFAVLEQLEGGLKRQYTLINFDSPEIFKAIREKLQTAWDQHPDNFVNGRNKLTHTRIKITVSGIFNQVDQGQANVQILVNSADDIKIEIL